MNATIIVPQKELSYKHGSILSNLTWKKTHSMDGRPTVKSSDAKPVESLRGNQPVDREIYPCLFYLYLSLCQFLFLPINLSIYLSI